MGIRLKAEKALNIHSYDWTPLLTLLATFILMYIGLVSGSIATKSLFIKRFGVEYLPYMFMVNAVLLFILSVFIFSFIDLVDQNRLFELSLFLFGVCIIAARVILVHDPSWIYPGLIILEFIVNMLLNLQFWLVATNLISTRQAKRLFPLIATGEIGGIIIGSFAIAGLVQVIGTPNLFIIWGICTFGAIIAFQFVRRGARKKNNHEEQHKGRSALSVITSDVTAMFGKIFSGKEMFGNILRSISEGFASIKSSKMLKVLFIIMIIYTILTWVLDYQYLFLLKSTFDSEDAISSFIGIFDGVLFSASLVFQLFLTNRIVQRFGINNSMLFLPGLYLGGYLVIGAVFVFNSIIGVYFGRKLLTSTVHKSSYQTLFNLIPKENRGRFKTIIEGITVPMALIIASLILLTHKHLHPDPATALRLLCFAMVPVGVLFLYFSLKLKKIYMEILISNLKGEDFDSQTSTLDIIGRMPPEATQKILLEALDEEDSSVAIFATEMLIEAGSDKNLPALYRALDRLFKRDDETATEIGCALLHCIGAIGGRKALPQLLAYLHKITNTRLLGTLIDLLGDTDEADTTRIVAALRGLQDHPDLQIRATAAAALWKLKESSGLDLLRGMLMSENTDERIQASSILHKIDCEGLYKIMLTTANDFVSSVRENTIKAMGEHQYQQASKMLIGKLSDMDINVRRTTQRALVKFGEQVVDDLISALENEDIGKQMKITVLEIIREIASKKWEEKFVSILMKERDQSIQYEIIKSLDVNTKLNSAGPVTGFVDRQLETAYRNLFISDLITSDDSFPARAMLLEALQEANIRIIDIVFRLEAIIEGNPLFNLVNRKKDSALSWEKDNAIEMLENICPKPLFSRLLPFLEEQHDRLRDMFGRYGFTAPDTPETLQEELLNHPAEIVRACSVYGVSDDLRQRFGDTITSLSKNDPSELVRETACNLSQRNQNDATAEKPGEATMITTLEKIMFLKRVPLFSKLSADELKIISQITKEQSFGSGEVIIREYEQSNNMEMYLIVSGQVDVIKETEEGQEKVLATLGEHVFFGEMSIFDNEPRSATVRAKEPTVCMTINQRDFRDLIVEYPRITFEIFRVFSMRLREVDELLARSK